VFPDDLVVGAAVARMSGVDDSIQDALNRAFATIAGGELGYCPCQSLFQSSKAAVALTFST